MAPQNPIAVVLGALRSGLKRRARAHLIPQHIAA
jgi:hypothetical protein